MDTRHAVNDEQARYWNGDEAAHWLVHEERYERMLAPFTGHLLAAAAIAGADRVLDDRDRIAAVLGAAQLSDVAIEPIADPPTVARVSEAVQAALEPYVTSDGVRLGSRAWLVTASRP